MWTFFPWMCVGSMTLGSREAIGVEGRRNPSRKPEGCDEEESGEQASEERSTKGDDGVEILNPSTTGLSPGSAPVLPASPPNRTGFDSTQHSQSSAEPAPPCHDQHHFLRSSVRPASKRIRKDSIGSTINGHGGAKSKGTGCCELREKWWQQLGEKWASAGGLPSVVTVFTLCWPGMAKLLLALLGSPSGPLAGSLLWADIFFLTAPSCKKTPVNNLCST